MLLWQIFSSQWEGMLGWQIHPNPILTTCQSQLMPSWREKWTPNPAKGHIFVRKWRRWSTSKGATARQLSWIEVHTSLQMNFKPWKCLRRSGFKWMLSSENLPCKSSGRLNFHRYTVMTPHCPLLLKTCLAIQRNAFPGWVVIVFQFKQRNLDWREYLRTQNPEPRTRMLLEMMGVENRITTIKRRAEKSSARSATDSSLQKYVVTH